MCKAPVTVQVLIAICAMQYLYNLHHVAEKHEDGQMTDFVEVMLEEQVWSRNEWDPD